MLRAFAFCALVLCVLHSHATDQLLKLSPRPNATTQALLTFDPARPPDFVALLIPGGLGDFEFTEARGGAVAMKNEARLPNRLRSLLLEKNVASVLVDAPSDRPKIDDGFRTSAEHVVDLKAVVQLLQERFPSVPVVAVGHSNGSISAAHLAAAAPELAKAVVLIAPRLTWNSFSNQYIKQDGLSKFDWERIRQPLMLAHHSKDGCPFTPYAASVQLAQKIPRFDLLAIDSPGAVAVGQCDYVGAHNLAGQEAAVADGIVSWARRAVPLGK